MDIFNAMCLSAMCWQVSLKFLINSKVQDSRQSNWRPSLLPSFFVPFLPYLPPLFCPFLCLSFSFFYLICPSLPSFILSFLVPYFIMPIPPLHFSLFPSLSPLLCVLPSLLFSLSSIILLFLFVIASLPYFFLPSFLYFGILGPL